MDWTGTVAIALIVVAGLSAPLAVSALSLAALKGWLLLRPEFAWIGLPEVFGAALVALLIQICADLYFVPITVKDRMYLNPRRMRHAYLHARIQSLLRPLAAALVVAALPLPLPDWMAAVGGFTGAAACYWLSAWIREYVAVTRGALVLFVLEMLKNALLIPLAVFMFWLPPLVLALLITMLVPTVLWTARLQHEHTIYPLYGGQHLGKDI